MTAHVCDEFCVCPEHRTPLIYWPHGDDHACQDITCEYGHGGLRATAFQVSALSEPDLAAVALHRGLEILLAEGKCTVNDARQVLGLRPFRFVTGRLPVAEGAGAGEEGPA